VLKVREAGRTMNVHVLVVTGVHALVSCATSSLQLPYNERMAFHSLQGHHLVSPLQGVH